jgi:hypothetical protein
MSDDKDKNKKPDSDYVDGNGNPIPLENFDDDWDPGEVPESMKALYEKYAKPKPKPKK